MEFQSFVLLSSYSLISCFLLCFHSILRTWWKLMKKSWCVSVVGLCVSVSHICCSCSLSLLKVFILHTSVTFTSLSFVVSDSKQFCVSSLLEKIYQIFSSLVLLIIEKMSWSWKSKRIVSEGDSN